MANLTTTPLADLVPDQRNANKGTARGRRLLKSSLSELGAGRSILLDKNNRIIAGNKTAAGAGEALDCKDVLVIETNGEQLIAVKRTDLDLEHDPRAKELALADNRIGQVDLDWDVDNLKALASDINMDKFFTQEELFDLGIGDPVANVTPPADATSNYKEQYGLIIVCGTEAEQQKVYEKLTREGYAVRVVVT